MLSHRFTFAHLIILIFATILLSVPYITNAQTEQPFEQTLRVTAISTVNVRADASTQNSPIATLKAGDTVTVLDQVSDGQAVSGNSLWYHVQLDDGTQGFVWSGSMSQPVMLQTCVHPREPQVSEVWLAIHDKQTPLIRWDSTPDSPHFLPGGTTGDEPLAWSSLVTSQALKDFLSPFGTFNITPLIDQKQCIDYGAILETPDSRLYAVHETPNSQDLGFIQVKDVSSIRQATSDDLQTLDEVSARNQQIQHFTQQPNPQDFLDEKIVWVGELQNIRGLMGSSDTYRLFFAPTHLGGVYRLTNNPDNEVETSPSWLPDGKKVVFHHRTEGFQGLQEGLGFFDMLTQQEGERTWIESTGPNAPSSVDDPTFSNDQSRIAISLETRPLYIFYHRTYPNIAIVPTTPNLDAEEGLQTIVNQASFSQGSDFSLSQPKWSPINDLIAFERDFTSTKQSEIWITDANGKELHKVGDGLVPLWSPNGQYLLFINETGATSSNWSYKIYLADSNGNNEIALTPNWLLNADGCIPSWSPNSEKIAFCYKEANENFTSLYIMNNDGTNLVRLTSDLGIQGVTWSPDGTHIAFVGQQPSDKSGYAAIYTINVDGTNRQLLTDGIYFFSDLSWLPAIGS